MDRKLQSGYSIDVIKRHSDPAYMSSCFYPAFLSLRETKTHSNVSYYTAFPYLNPILVKCSSFNTKLEPGRNDTKT